MNDNWKILHDGTRVKILQTNNVTYYVEDESGKKFNVAKGQIMEPPISIVETLRKPSIKQGVLVEVKHIPEHYDIRINNVSINKYSDEELFGWIQNIEAEMAELEKITNRPLALAKLLDEKRTSINRICAWMNARK